jgi:hypothetical protein
METPRPDAQLACAEDIADVRITRATDGGWDVIATLGDRILAIQHCDDWHRAERAYLRMSGDTQRHRLQAA